jgi:hypothetical protein
LAGWAVQGVERADRRLLDAVPVRFDGHGLPVVLRSHACRSARRQVPAIRGMPVVYG